MAQQHTSLPNEAFGQTPDGHPARVYTLANDKMRVRVSDFGGRLVSIEVPDRHGRNGHVLLGFDSVETYATMGGSFGALLGRVANRIAGGQVEIDGQVYDLSRNDGQATLHGGAAGFGKLFWTVSEAIAGEQPILALTLVSPDGDQGFPGELKVTATYQLTGDTLSLSFHATTSKPTVINLSAHPYFNLAGPETGDVLNHEVMLSADGFLPTDATQIPTGEIRPVQGTIFDFREPKSVGMHIRQPDGQLIIGTGYDHCFVLRSAGAPALAARVRDPISGRVLEIYTDQPSIQFYTGNKLNGTLIGLPRVIYRQAAGLALEAQDFPDAPHHADFPSIVLRPGQDYRRSIQYRFYTT